jgi:hypothetical protein
MAPEEKYMEREAEMACSDPPSKPQQLSVEYRLLLQLAELQIENERLREDNLQLRAALSIFSEVAKRSLASA